jgi:small-conductance mechanosensitive channel
LHEAIHQTLADHHIEIAFPQRDLNVRSVDPTALSVQSAADAA